MKVLVVERNREPYVKEINNDLSSKQSLVDGPIDVLDPWDDSVVVVLNDEGKNLGMPINRKIGNIEIAGRFFLCNRDQYGNLYGMTDYQIREYTRLFSSRSMKQN